MFLSTRLWWNGQWPGYQHPLRAAWRKAHENVDPRRNVAFAAFMGLLILAVFELFIILRGNRGEPVAASLVVFANTCAVLSGLILFTIFLNGGHKFRTFTKTIAMVNRSLGIYVTKDFSEHELRRSADIKLCELAGRVIRSEAAIAERPHKDELHGARRKAREDFASAHKLFLDLGLVEPTWDPYFQRQR